MPFEIKWSEEINAGSKAEFREKAVTPELFGDDH